MSEAQAAANLGLALRDQKIETTRARLEAKKWKRKAFWRGLVNWLGAATLAAGVGLLVTH